MIRLPGIRDKGPGPLLGASRDGEPGPYGIRGRADEEQLDEDGLDDGEQQADD